MHQLPDAFAAMAAYTQWIIWKVAPHPTKPGKLLKLPADFRTGHVVSAHDSSIWTHPAQAIASAAHFGADYGVGFVFTHNDPFWFLDIDGAHDANGWSATAIDLCNRFAGCAVEVSVSGAGLHIFGTTAGPIPPHGTDNKIIGCQFYTSGRFVAMTGTGATGNAGMAADGPIAALIAQYFMPDAAARQGTADTWTDTPREDWRGPEDDDELLRRALRSTSAEAAFSGKASFHDLWHANVEVLSKSYPPDPNSTSPYGESEADSALASHLAFWTGCNCDRIAKLMRQSALVRAKWDERDDYLPRTILAVCARQGSVLSDATPEPAGLPSAMLQPGERSIAERPKLTEGAVYLSIEEQRDMFIGCVYVCDVDKILVPGGRMYSERQFRSMFGGYTFPLDPANARSTRNAWEAFTQNEAFRATKADGSCFKPGLSPGELVEDGGRVLVNTWWPVNVERRTGDLTPFFTHLAKLLPDERDRTILLSYMAACVQYVGYKFQWAPLLQGVEGNGKSLLTRCVANAVGRRYVHWPKASKLAAQFNGWMVGKVFYAVEDIYTPDARTDVIEELKPMITGGDGLEIEGKGADQITADICGNFMFNSNHKDAIKKTRNDRRFAVFYTAQQAAADLMRDGMAGTYMYDIYNWLREQGGYAMVSELLATWPIPDEFNPAGSCQRAPMTSSTEEAITSSLGGIEQEVMEAIHQQSPGFAGGWVSSHYLTELLERIGRARAVPINKRPALMLSLGYVPHPALPDGRVNNTIQPDGNKPRLYVHQSSPLMALTLPAEVASMYTNAQLVALGIGAVTA
jgi:hypothetical protein